MLKPTYDFDNKQQGLTNKDEKNRRNQDVQIVRQAIRDQTQIQTVL